MFPPDVQGLEVNLTRRAISLIGPELTVVFAVLFEVIAMGIIGYRIADLLQ